MPSGLHGHQACTHCTYRHAGKTLIHVWLKNNFFKITISSQCYHFRLIKYFKVIAAFNSDVLLLKWKWIAHVHALWPQLWWFWLALEGLPDPWTCLYWEDAGAGCQVEKCSLTNSVSWTAPLWYTVFRPWLAQGEGGSACSQLPFLTPPSNWLLTPVPTQENPWEWLRG